SNGSCARSCVAPSPSRREDSPPGSTEPPESQQSTSRAHRGAVRRIMNFVMTNVLLTLLLALTAVQSADLLSGMPPPLEPHDVYAAGRPGNMSSAVKGFPD